MESMDKKLFHGINLLNYSEQIDNLKEIDVFKEILKRDAILTREDLYGENNYVNKYINRIYGQLTNEICIAMHPHSKNFNINGPIADAFYEFIRFNLSFIFDMSILNNRKYKLSLGIPGEIRLTNSLNLSENLIAIGYFDEIDYIYDKSDKISNGIYNSMIANLLNCKDIEKYVLQKKLIYYQVRELLDLYKLNVPIVDPYDGEIINDNYEYDIDKCEIILTRVNRKCIIN